MRVFISYVINLNAGCIDCFIDCFIACFIDCFIYCLIDCFINCYGLKNRLCINHIGHIILVCFYDITNKEKIFNRQDE